MRGEYSFFHIAPEAMKRFLVPTFDFRSGAKGASYSMEHLLVPDAAVQMVHHSFEAEGFERLLEGFFDYLSVRPTREVSRAQIRETWDTDIIGKMHERVGQVLGTAIGERVDAHLRNGGPCGDLRAVESRATKLLERAADRSQDRHLAFGHGDPCLSNILFARDVGLFRLIDPRGAETIESGFMHPLYDISKFSHSILGGYDFINNDLFECSIADDLTIGLELKDGGPPDWMRQAFRDRLKSAGFDLYTVRCQELSLFLSMLPLHADRPRKLLAFCMNACAIIADLEAMQ